VLDVNLGGIWHELVLRGETTLREARHGLGSFSRQATGGDPGVCQGA